MTIVKWGNTDLNSTFAGAGDHNAVAALPNGGYVVVRRDGGTIHVRIFDAAGTQKASTTVGTTTLQKVEPDVVVLKDGSFVVSWSGDSKEIRGQKFSIDGVADPAGVIAIASPSVSTSTNKNFPAMATNGDGWAVVWQEVNVNVGAGTTDIIRFERRNADGTKSGNTIDIELDTGAATPDVAELSGGRHIVTWVDSGVVKGAIVAANGTVTPLSENVRDGSTGSNPSVTALSNGGFVIAIQNNIDANTGSYIIQAYNSAGAKVTTGSNTITTPAGFPPAIIPLTKGGFEGGYAIAYSAPSFDNNGNRVDHGDIYIRFVKANGTMSEAFMVNDTSWDGFGTQSLPSVTELPDGRVSVTWSDPNSNGVRHQIIDGREEVVHVIGTGGADFYIGTDLIDKGSDILEGKAGNDTLWGGSGNDKLNGGVGADSLVGGNGQDTVTYEDAVADANGAGVKVYFLNPGENYGEAAGDSYSSIEVIDGSGHKDTIEGGAGNDTFWGANGDDLLKGFGGDDKLIGGNGSDTFYGGAGADTFEGGDDTGWDTVTYEFTNAGVVVDLTNTDNNQGEAIGDGYSGIEAFIGSQGHDTIRGYADEVNSFLGKAGNDSLVGGNLADALGGDAGNDILQGGLGADDLVGGEGTDFASYADATGPVRANLHNAVSNAGDYAQGDTYTSIEGLIGSGSNDTLTGLGEEDNGLLENNNWLIGGGGDDLLEGLTGDDTLMGGVGADTLAGGWGFDFVSYADSAGPITVVLRTGGTGAASGDSFTSIEGLIGSARGDTLTGNDANNHLKGEGGNDGLNGGGGIDTLEGGAGDDVLNGGASADRLEGGIGNDTYYVAAGDRIVEHAGQGTDTVVITSDFVVTGNDFANIENIILDISTLNNTLTGSETDNVLTGNDAGNRLEGLGGNDTLYGLGGNDGLFGGAGDDALFGGAGIDALFGDAGNDILDGGTGIDAMNGGVGNDVYYVNDAGDSVVEAAGGGIDTVYASVNFNMGAGTEVEYLYATGAAGLILTGSNFANTIIGNAGANKIYGGLGNDMLTGGAGKDIFVFDTRPNKSTNVDRIMDFNVRDDSFHLDNKYFTNLGSGTASKPKKFNSDMFVINNKAKDREDRVVYDKKTGALYYDQDGTGSKAQIKIATLNKNLKLTYSDFFVI